MTVASAQEYHSTAVPGVSIHNTAMPDSALPKRPSGCWVGAMLCAGMGVFAMVVFLVSFTASVSVSAQDSSEDNYDNLSDGMDSLALALAMLLSMGIVAVCLLAACVSGIIGCSSVSRRTCLLSLAAFAAALCTGMLVALVIYLARRSHHDSRWEEAMRVFWMLDGSFCGLVLLVLLVWSVVRWRSAEVGNNGYTSVDSVQII